MEYIINEPDFVKRHTKKYSLLTLACFVIMITSFLIGRYWLKDLAKYFIIFAAIFSIVVAKFAVRCIMYIRFKDPDEKSYNLLRKIAKSNYLLNSILLTNEKHRVFFDHVVVAPNKIYFIALSDIKKDKRQRYSDIAKFVLERNHIEKKYKVLYSYEEAVRLVDNILNKNKYEITEDQKENARLIKNFSIK